MHDICPSIADLTDTHPPSRSLRVHVAECASCRALARLAAASGDPLAQRSPECDEVELLIAVIAGGGALDGEDGARFARHAGACDRCAANAAAVLLDRDDIAQLLERPAAPAAPPDAALASGDWKPAVDPELGRALRRRRRTLLAGGAAVVAAVAASVAILASRPAPTARTTAPDPAPAADRRTAPAAPPVFRSLPTRDQELEAARAAIEGRRYLAGLGYCQAVLDRTPDDQDALRFCAIAACKLESAAPARDYIGRITSETRREMLRQICLQSGIEVDPPAKPADPGFDADLEAARKAAFDGDYRTALTRCQAALRQRRGDQEANKTCAVAACKLRDARRARTYIRRIESETRQQMIRQMCKQSGVQVAP